MAAAAPRAVSLERLRARHASDVARRRAGDADATAARLERALRAIGWGGTDVADAEEVARLLEPVLDAGVAGGAGLAALHREVADVLRGAGPLLDGSLPPAAAYVPAAEALLTHYAEDDE